MRRVGFVLLCLWSCGQSESAAPSFHLRVARAEAGKPARLEVTCAQRGIIQSGELPRWASSLTLKIDGQTGAIAGTHRLEQETLVFESTFGLVGGTKYVALFASGGNMVEALTERFTVAKPKPDHLTRVTRVYPSASALPCNVLRFYIEFSHPMREGQGQKAFALVDERGVSVREPFKEVELWNQDSTRLTLYLHPGRIKRGVGLNAELGPILRPSRKYSLVIGRALKDAAGNELAQEFRKTFATTAADHAQPNVQRWKLSAPRAGTRAPLVVTFEERMDNALVRRLMRVHRGQGAPLDGTIAVEQNERVWRFTPGREWARGDHRLTADGALEDLVGNSLDLPFEVLTGSAPRAGGVHARGFTVR